MLCGKHNLEWHNFEYVFLSTSEHYIYDPDIPLLRTVARVKRTILAKTHVAYSFRHLFVDFHNEECSDSKDKIFALLSIYNACTGKEMMIPDYALSVEVVYAKVLLHVGMESSEMACGDGYSFAQLLQKTLKVSLDNESVVQATNSFHLLHSRFGAVDGWILCPNTPCKESKVWCG